MAADDDSIAIDALTGFMDRSLLDTMDQSARSGANTALAEALATLHNEGRIDFLEIATWPELTTLPTHRTYFIEKFLNAVLPSLEATTPAILAYVMVLESSLKTSRRFLDGVQAWMAAHPAQAREIVEETLKEGSTAAPLLSNALQAVGDLTLIRQILLDHADERRERALHAIGWTVHPDPSEVATSVATLASVLKDEADDALRAQGLTALTTLFDQADVALTPEAVRLLARLAAGAGDLTRHQAARALFQTETLGIEATTVILDALLNVDPKHKGTLDNLDLALSKMLAGAFRDEALAFLGRLIAAAGGEIALSTFEITTSQLLTGPHDVLADTIIDWLLSGDPTLGKGVEKLLGRIGGNPVVLVPDLRKREFSGDRLISLSRKAVGFLHLQPVTAASILAAAMRAAPKAVASKIEALLFETLLVNYSGDLEAYLRTVGKSDKAYASVRRALRRKAGYLKGLQAVGRLPELRPSAVRRQIEHERHSDEMRQSFAVARSASPLLGLIRSSTLLYGRRSMNFMVDFNGERQSTEIMLQSHGSSFEVARGLKLDPMGLEEMSLIFRAEPVAP